jgi:bifunctional non-homologous end joining protein LigD
MSTFLRLPEPMLARSGPIPNGPGWVFEPKLDGYRCLVCTHGRFRARSRRGWGMTALLPELKEALPPNVQLDGELVAFDDLGRPDFHLLGERMLQRRSRVPVTFMAFDLLARDGESLTAEPYRERRGQLETLELAGSTRAWFQPSPTVKRCSPPSASTALRESSRSARVTDTGLVNGSG